MLVADSINIKRLDATGGVVTTYDVPNEDAWRALNLDPDGWLSTPTALLILPAATSGPAASQAASSTGSTSASSTHDVSVQTAGAGT